MYRFVNILYVLSVDWGMVMHRDPVCNDYFGGFHVGLIGGGRDEHGPQFR